MHPGVSSTRAFDRGVIPTNLPQGLFKRSLDSTSARLTLEAQKFSTVIRQNNFVRCHGLAIENDLYLTAFNRSTS
jgi:hypothetical protein